MLGVSACGYIAPQQTTVVYSASDGVRLDLGSVELRNILVVSGGADEAGRVIGAVFNTSKSNVTVTINGSKGSQTQFVVKPGTPYYLNEKNDSSILSTVTAAPGAMETIKVSQTGSGEASSDLSVPVLDGTLAEYKPYLPTKAGSSASPSSTSSESPSSTDMASSTETATDTASSSPSGH
nr:hypothetical protein [Psychromicrobium silvestre]